MSHSSSDLSEKRKKLASNYETIRVFKEQLDQKKREERLGMTRASYIKMILDVTSKVDKQNETLKKVCVDIRGLQKDIGTLSGRLDRSFTSVETLILRNIKHFGWSHESYKMLGTMHENCDQLITAIQDIGDMTREMKQLEDEIGQIRLRQRASS